MTARIEIKRRPYELTRREVRRLQTFLNSQANVKLPEDGLLGQSTVETAFEAYRSGVQVPPDILWLLQTVAMFHPNGGANLDVRAPPVWIFYSNAIRSRGDWVDRLQTGDTIFWIHGRYPRGGSYKRRLRMADTVLLLVGQDFIGGGLLLADDSQTFVDRFGRLRRPVRVVDRLSTPLPRAPLEALLGRPLITQGAVHPLPPDALSWLEKQNWGSNYQLPYSFDLTEQALASRGLDQDVSTDDQLIRPDAETASQIGWGGTPWTEADLPSQPEIYPLLTTGASGPNEEPETPDAEEFEESLHEQGHAQDRIEATVVSGVATAAGTATVDAQAAAGSERKEDVQIPFVLDAPSEFEDELDRGRYALFLAQRLHLIWCQINGHAPGPDGKRMKPSKSDSDTFIAHVDSPWGGGKSTFANFIARVLDPRRETLTERHFLRTSLAATAQREELRKVNLKEVFAPPYALKEPDDWKGARRPWIVVRYNAWRDQYVQPPWWQLFLAIQKAVSEEIRRDIPAEESLTGPFRWLWVQANRIGYQLWNTKLQTQAWIWGFGALLLLILWWAGAVHFVLQHSVLGETDKATHAAAQSGAKGLAPAVDPKEIAAWLALVVSALAFVGASLGTLVTVVSQSLSPDLDFTAEHKQIGVRDPIDRFRRTFQRIVEATPRPVLLIVDDLDRCEPKTVVEILRGFQTIIRSPRLFVLLLGDRAWIEAAHDVQHKDLETMSSTEGGLGSLYVQKVIQLSFRLPIMMDAARAAYARRVLGEADEDTAKEAAEVLRKAEAAAARVASNSLSVGEKEAAFEEVKSVAQDQLPDSLSDNQRAAVVSLLGTIVSAKAVAAAGADTESQRSVFNAITQLIDCLPSNPRQIKRIFMAFATYEQVGRSLYDYKVTEDGENGVHRAKRWRQLAMWVTLAVEWQETWRWIARRPDLLRLAYEAASEDFDPVALESAMIAELSEVEASKLRQTLRKLRQDLALRALLSGKPRGNVKQESMEFALTSMEPEAVYEFNRIIWEPGFPIEAPA